MSKFVEGIFTIEDEKRNYGILLNKVTNEFKIVLREDALKLDKWCERIKLKEYTIEELKILENYFSKIFDMENNKLKLSEKNINNTNEIIEVRLMVQLACNLKCKYCYANEGTYGHNDKMVMTETDSFNIFMKLMEIGVNKIQHISFFGGEPNVYDKTIIATLDHIQSLYNNKKLIEMPRFFLITNGTIFSDELIMKLKEYDVKITVSLDGPKEINDQLRIQKNGEGTYDIILENLRKLRDYGIEPAMIEATYTRIHENYNFTRRDITSFLEKTTNVPLIMLADCTGSEYSPIYDKKMNEQNLFNSIDSVMNGEVNTQSDYDTLNLVSVVIKQLYNKTILNNIHCSAGYQSISVSGNGDYFPCHRYFENNEFKLGNLFEKNDKLNLNKISTKDNNHECTKCWAVQFCNGCTWEMSKDLDKEMKLCNDRRKLYKYILLSYVNLDDIKKKIIDDNISIKNLRKSMPIINQY